jgi:hypothetical protein
LLGISGPAAAGIEVKEEAFELDSGFSRAGRTGRLPDLPVRRAAAGDQPLSSRSLKSAKIASCKKCISADEL